MDTSRNIGTRRASIRHKRARISSRRSAQEKHSARIRRGALLALQIAASDPEWGPNRVKDCDRECRVCIMDGYMNAIYQHDPKAVPPLSVDVRMTENTAI